jgi:hypothetical protein
VIRGGEISCSGNIVVREGGPPSGDPCSGGWGQIVYETSDFTVYEGTLTFYIPPEIIEGKYPSWHYDLEWYTYGAWYEGDQIEDCDCWTGPVRSIYGGGWWACKVLDLNEDGHTDLKDYALIQQEG